MTERLPMVDRKPRGSMWGGLRIGFWGPFRVLLDTSFGKGDYSLMLVAYHGDKLGYARCGYHNVHVHIGIALTLFKFVIGFEIVSPIKVRHENENV